MHQIHATQIKMARASLGWSQEDLAQKAGLAVTTIRKLETGYVPRGSTTEAICHTIEKAGLEFIEMEGVRRRANEIEIRRHEEAFFEEMLETAHKEGGGLLAILQSQDLLVRLGKSAGAYAATQCLLPDTEGPDDLIHGFRFRKAPKEQLGPASYFVYGNRHALILPDEKTGNKFIVFHTPALSLSYRAHFLSMWRTIEKTYQESSENRHF